MVYSLEILAYPSGGQAIILQPEMAMIGLKNCTVLILLEAPGALSFVKS